jgi:RNA polymerase sigma factor (TIGR02999 family)
VGHDAAVGRQARSHFVAVAARTMRRLLIDHARRKAAEKRGGGWARVTLGDAEREVIEDPDQYLALDAALEELAQMDPRAAQVVELRFFGGFGMDEIARHLDVSRRTVQDDWAMARAWLHRRLG